jgi:hypothetical protein
MSFHGIADAFVIGAARGVVALLEVDFAFAVELTWRDARVEVRVFAINFFLNHQHFADEDLPCWQEHHVTQIPFLDKI